jgi:multiple sugar transport system substrate-binding protein
MLIGASSEMQDEAWEFVQFMTSEESQKLHTLSASTLPTLNALYEDREIRKVLPVITLSEEALRNARPRPISPYYSQISRTMAEQFNKVLTYLTRRGRRDSPERFAADHRAGLISPQTKVLHRSSH